MDADSSSVGSEDVCVKYFRPCYMGSEFGDPGSFGKASKQIVHAICVQLYKNDQRKFKDKAYKAMISDRSPEQSAVWYLYDVFRVVGREPLRITSAPRNFFLIPF